MESQMYSRYSHTFILAPETLNSFWMNEQMKCIKKYIKKIGGWGNTTLKYLKNQVLVDKTLIQ